MVPDRDANDTGRGKNSIALFQLCDRGVIPLLGDENDKKAPLPFELGSQNFLWWVFNSPPT